MESPVAVPPYLATPSDFRAFMSDQFEGATTVEKGNKFAGAALAFLKGQDWAQSFPNIRLNPKKANELGRDIISDKNSVGTCFFAEAKYSLDGVEQLDSVLSKWQELERQTLCDSSEPATLFGPELGEESRPHFALVAGVSLDAIVKRYESQHRSSRTFYDELQESGRLHIYGLGSIYRWVRESYIRQHGIPSNFTLTAPNAWSNLGAVYTSAVSGPDIVSLVDRHGEALFFENIRGWIGAESQVNSTIIDTIRNEPEKFLERNNGLTLRAKKVSISSDGRSLEISEGNIINGCQTTMALWHSRPTSDQLCVQVKVVQANDDSDAWKIAQSANYQNQVTLLELKLAQHLRPQLVARHATRTGQRLQVHEPNSLQAVLRAIGETDVTYEFAKYLFLGLFSRRPNDLFADNYSKILGPVIAEYYELSEDAENRLFECLFRVIEHGRSAIDSAARSLAQRDHSESFARVFQEEGVKYQALICLLAASGALREDLSERLLDDSGAEARRLSQFIAKLNDLLERDSEHFELCCKWALNTVFSDVMRDNDDYRKMRQYLSGRVKEASFTRLYQGLGRSLDLL